MVARWYEEVVSHCDEFYYGKKVVLQNGDFLLKSRTTCDDFFGHICKEVMSRGGDFFSGNCTEVSATWYDFFANVAKEVSATSYDFFANVAKQVSATCNDFFVFHFILLL